MNIIYLAKFTAIECTKKLASLEITIKLKYIFSNVPRDFMPSVCPVCSVVYVMFW